MKTKNPTKIIEAALNERDNKCFVEARTKLRELNVLLDNRERSKFLREINLLTTDINNNFKSIEAKYGLRDKQGIGISQIKFPFSSIPLLKENTKIFCCRTSFTTNMPPFTQKTQDI